MFKYFLKKNCPKIQRFHATSTKTVNTVGDTNLFLGGWGPKTNSKQNRCLVDPNLRTFRSSRKLRYEQIIFFEDDSIFSCIFCNIFGDQKGGVKVHYGSKTNPYFGSSQNHPKSMGIWPGTLISHFGII